MKENKTDLFKLYPFVVSYTNNKIYVSNFIYFESTNIIREIFHPAKINQEKGLLIIDQYISQGKDTSYCIKSFNDFILELPDWNLTSTFLIKKGLYESPHPSRWICSSFLEINW
jgi:hypothetical protein